MRLDKEEARLAEQKQRYQESMLQLAAAATAAAGGGGGGVGTFYMGCLTSPKYVAPYKPSASTLTINRNLLSAQKSLARRKHCIAHHSRAFGARSCEAAQLAAKSVSCDGKRASSVRFANLSPDHSGVVEAL